MWIMKKDNEIILQMLVGRCVSRIKESMKMLVRKFRKSSMKTTILKLI